VLVLLTKHHEFGSTTIAPVYKDRWQIEIFFKTIEQNLKIKTFVGTEVAGKNWIGTKVIKLL